MIRIYRLMYLSRRVDDREIPLAKVGGAYARSKYFDASIDAELKKAIPREDKLDG